MFNDIQYNLLKPIFKLIAWAYDLLLGFISSNMFDSVTSFTNSIYVLAGIFMLFRLAVSFLNYLINPDSFSDKSSGGTKILSHVVLAIVFVVAAPTVFSLLGRFQNNIVGDNIIFRVININGAVTPGIVLPQESCIKTNGSELAATAFTAFLHRTENWTASAENDATLTNAINWVFARSANNTCSSDTNVTQAELFLGNKFKGDELTLDFLIALIAGLAMVVFIVIMAVDIVVRNLKILLLQMISPVAFIAYIDPKDKIFNQWLKAYGSVYADLFVKLIALAFVIQLVGFVNNQNLDGFSMIFYILGIFVFAKAVPSFISKIFGIDGAGSFKESANMLKKGLGFAAGGAALAVGAGFAAHKANQAQRAQRKARGENFKSKWDAAKDKEGNINHGMRAKALGSSALSALGQAGRTAKMMSTSAVKGAGAGFQGKGISSTFAGAISEGDNLATAIEGGATFKDRTLASVNKTLGTTWGKGAKYKEQKAALDEVASKEKATKSLIKEEMDKKNVNGIATAKMRLEAMEQANKDGNYAGILEELGYTITRDATGKVTVATNEAGEIILEKDINNKAREFLVSERKSYSEKEKETTELIWAGKDKDQLLTNTPEIAKAAQEYSEAVQKAVNTGAFTDSKENTINISIATEQVLDKDGNVIAEKGGFIHTIKNKNGENIVDKYAHKETTDWIVNTSADLASEMEKGTGAARAYVDGKKSN